MQKNNWDIIAVLNNDMIGNIEGIDGVIDNYSFRIFSEPTPANESENDRKKEDSMVVKLTEIPDN